MKFSIITVTYNSGEKLKNTIDSILKQSFNDYEIIVKDGGSTDGSIEKLSACGFDKVRIIQSKDAGIYDAMNQAVKAAVGEYVIFLNSGDRFFDNSVLSAIVVSKVLKSGCIAYGDTYFVQYGTVAKACPKISGFSLYRNMPCHQSIIYSRDVLLAKPYDTNYKIRADYEQLLHSFFKARVKFSYVAVTIAKYEGGGSSELDANKAIVSDEFKRASKEYIPAARLFLYKAALVLTFSKIRRWMAHNPATAGLYENIKKHIIYR